MTMKRCAQPIFKLNLVLCALIFTGRIVYAEEYFNPALLMNANGKAVADLSKFEQGFQLPGRYAVDVYLNDEFVANQEFNFSQDSKSDAVSGGLIPCLDVQWLQSAGVRVYDFIPEAELSEQCVDLKKYIPEAEVSYNFSLRRLAISIPQIWVKKEARGYIPPSQWSEGITAGLLNYNLSGNHSSDNDNLFLSLYSGLNVSGFRFRNFSSYNYSNNSKNNTSNSAWNNVYSYVEKSIVPWKSELIIGDSNTNGNIFDSVGFRGVRLYNSDAMLPNTMQGYAPVIRGIASNKGTVTVHQNGYVVYQMNVTPGPFEINDLSAMNLSGDLKVTVEDATGIVQSYTVPYSGVPSLLREGRTKFDITAGEFRSGNKEQSKPFFFEGTLSRGFSKGITLYSGTQLAADYQAALLGIGANMGRWGALSFDVTHANSRLANDQDYSGQSYRFLYSKSLNELGTTFQLLSYRYSTKGFYTLNDVAYKNMERFDTGMKYDQYGNSYYDPSSYYNLNYSKKGQFQLNINQNLEKYGSIFATANYQTYWNTPRTSKNYQVGYSNSLQYFSYNLTWMMQDSFDLFSGKNNTISASISVPFSAFFGRSNRAMSKVYSNTSYINNSKGSDSFQTGINGQLLEDDKLNYSISAGHNNETGSFGSATANLNTRYGSGGVGVNFSNGGDHTDINYNFSGGMIVHRGGVTLGQSLGDTNILVNAHGAKNVKIENSRNVKTNSSGYAIIPFAENYRLNRIALLADSLDDKTEILTNVRNLVPMRGAVLQADFDSRIGYRALISFNYAGGDLPYGSTVSEDKLKISSLVGLNNKTFLSGLANKGVLKISWGNTVAESCIAEYDFSKAELNNPLIQLNLNCR